ncbi:MAG: hypothetical protein Q4D67_07015 [Streptococcus minor]|nr:hypothetical protein [Streptococcus minor]MDO5079365.1 hypothetical protein [Streptococcus minor]
MRKAISFTPDYAHQGQTISLSAHYIIKNLPNEPLQNLDTASKE